MMEQSNGKIEQRLRAEKPMRRVPPGFTEQVMSRLPAVVELEAPAPDFLLWPRVTFAFALMVVAGFIVTDFDRSKEHPTVGLSQKPNAIVLSENSGPTITVVDLAIPAITQIQTLTVKLDDPLEKELSKVISDTRQAIQFVAMNFLPEK